MRIFREWDNYNYPAGADGPDAPWNQGEDPDSEDYSASQIEKIALQAVIVNIVRDRSYFARPGSGVPSYSQILQKMGKAFNFLCDPDIFAEDDLYSWIKGVFRTNHLQVRTEDDYNFYSAYRGVKGFLPLATKKFISLFHEMRDTDEYDGDREAWPFDEWVDELDTVYRTYAHRTFDTEIKKDGMA